jgi:hypothetical protein
MPSVEGLNASNPNIKRGIYHTRIFWQLTHQSLLMPPTPWKQIAGSEPQSPSLGYFTVQSIRRFCTQHSNSKAQLEPGGRHTLPPYLLIIMSYCVSSV